jgi:hypothetical protein
LRCVGVRRRAEAADTRGRILWMQAQIVRLNAWLDASRLDTLEREIGRLRDYVRLLERLPRDVPVPESYVRAAWKEIPVAERKTPVWCPETIRNDSSASAWCPECHDVERERELAALDTIEQGLVIP